VNPPAGRHIEAHLKVDFIMHSLLRESNAGARVVTTSCHIAHQGSPMTASFRRSSHHKTSPVQRAHHEYLSRFPKKPFKVLIDCLLPRPPVIQFPPSEEDGKELPATGSTSDKHFRISRRRRESENQTPISAGPDSRTHWISEETQRIQGSRAAELEG
jgi:hypothetical protein